MDASVENVKGRLEAAEARAAAAEARATAAEARAAEEEQKFYIMRENMKRYLMKKQLDMHSVKAVAEVYRQRLFTHGLLNPQHTTCGEVSSDNQVQLNCF